MEHLQSAILIAVQAHHGQTDKQGLPYILHPLRVMLGVQQHGENAMIVAVLHDVLEDTPVEFHQIPDDYPMEVLVAVLELTKLPGITYMDYIRELAPNKLARQVKMADLHDNMTRPGWFPGKESLYKRYTVAWDYLASQSWVESPVVVLPETPERPPLGLKRSL